MSKHQLFRFKQFSIDHSASTMKVGTDGVLLGAWLNTNGARRILDIGAGSGVIALMMAQRTDSSAHIDAVEIEEADARQAIENIRNSPWPQKVTVHSVAVQEFRPDQKYDLIVSNPPYFRDSYQPPDVRRVRSRHTTSLSYEDLIACVDRLLHENGTFDVILPPVEGEHVVGLAAAKQLHVTRKFLFRTREHKVPERWLLEFSRYSGTISEGEVLLYDRGEEWSEQYRKLTAEFYLKA